MWVKFRTQARPYLAVFRTQARPYLAVFRTPPRPVFWGVQNTVATDCKTLRRRSEHFFSVKINVSKCSEHLIFRKVRCSEHCLIHFWGCSEHRNWRKKMFRTLRKCSEHRVNICPKKKTKCSEHFHSYPTSLNSTIYLIPLLEYEPGRELLPT